MSTFDDDTNDIYTVAAALVLSSSQADAAAYEAVDGYRGNASNAYRRGYSRGATRSNRYSRSDRREFRNDVRDNCYERYGG